MKVKGFGSTYQELLYVVYKHYHTYHNFKHMWDFQMFLNFFVKHEFAFSFNAVYNIQVMLFFIELNLELNNI